MPSAVSSSSDFRYVIFFEDGRIKRADGDQLNAWCTDPASWLAQCLSLLSGAAAAMLIRMDGEPAAVWAKVIDEDKWHAGMTYAGVDRPTAPTCPRHAAPASAAGIPQRALPAGHPDLPIIERVCAVLEAAAEGWAAFEREIPSRLREAIDEVIDTPRSGRFLFDQLEKTEKTYIGTKVEILVRDFLKVPKGLLDLVVDGMAVDVKNTVTGSWMIPREAYGHPCILLHENEVTSECSVGVIIAHEANLTAGANQDGKRSISSAGRANIHWLLFRHPYPTNFWADVGPEVRVHIMRPRGGNKRVVRLMLENLRRPVPIRIAEGIARQEDFRRRMRGGGGARDILGKLGVVLLNGTFDAALFAHFGMPVAAKSEYVAVPVETDYDLEVVQGDRHPYVTCTYDAEEAATHILQR